jgi:hypothetical protein
MNKMFISLVLLHPPCYVAVMETNVNVKRSSKEVLLTSSVIPTSLYSLFVHPRINLSRNHSAKGPSERPILFARSP